MHCYKLLAPQREQGVLLEVQVRMAGDQLWSTAGNGVEVVLALPRVLLGGAGVHGCGPDPGDHCNEDVTWTAWIH
eukprot:284740-Pelagomonas_calceolata.AAC.1